MKKTYVSVNGVRKPVRKLYVSVGGKAKLVKKVYGSVGGKAKPIYDTCVVSYVDDNGYINNTNVSATERVAIGCKASKRGNKHWYKSDGTEWNFDTQLTGDIKLYEAVYQNLDQVSFDGHHYVPTDIVIQKSQMDLRGVGTISSVSKERRLFSIWGTPSIEIYVDGSLKWNIAAGNNTSSVSWGLRGDKAYAAVAGTKLSFRTNPYAVNTKDGLAYSQFWASNIPSDKVWKMLLDTPLSANPTATLCIGGAARSANTNFKGVITDITYQNNAYHMSPKKRIKGGTTTQGFYTTANNKFYPLVSH